MDTLSNMRVFMRVVDAGSFTAAARHLNSTTAQVSRAIADLETHLRTRLLNRTTRRLAVTEAGQRYLQRCEHILAVVDEAEAEAANANVVASGTLRIHAMTSFGQRYLVPALAQYRQAHPEVSVELTLSQRIPDLLDEGYDTAVVLTNGLPDSGMISQQLGVVYTVICASPDYLKRHGRPQTPSELLSHPCLQLQSPFFPIDEWIFEKVSSAVDVSKAAGAAMNDVMPAIADAGAESVGYVPERVYIGSSPFRVNAAEALDHAIRQGMGIGMLPSYSAVEGLSDGSLERLFEDYRLQRFEVHALYPSRQYIDAKIRTWVDFISATLPQAMADDDVVLARLGRP